MPSPKFRNSQFRVPTFIGTVLVICIAGAAGILLFKSTSEDEQEYRKLIERANPINSNTSPAPYSANQTRKQVTKDIFYNQGDDRLHIKLFSAESSIALDYKDQQTEVLEHMKSVKCFMQEELFYTLANGRELLKNANGKYFYRNSNPNEESSWYKGDASKLKPMQSIRILERDTADYYYQTQSLLAKNVKIYRYVIPGHALAKLPSGAQPCMKGDAESVTFSTAEKNFHFKAHKLKAIILPTAHE